MDRLNIFPSEIPGMEEDLFSYAKAEIHVKFHIERTALYEFIFLPGSVTLWPTV